ncbi:hypothetical protein AAAC51_39670 [Priestia megaterium]
MNKEQVIEIYQDVLDKRRKRFPNYFFAGNEGKKYMRYMTCYLLEQHLSIPIDEIPFQVGANTLWSHRLRPLLCYMDGIIMKSLIMPIQENLNLGNSNKLLINIGTGKKEREELLRQ